MELISTHAIAHRQKHPAATGLYRVNSITNPYFQNLREKKLEIAKHCRTNRRTGLNLLAQIFRL